jgi:Family of unknown function (DUF6368)
MGGPGASVLLHDPLTKQQVNELDLWIQSITNELEGNALNGYSFWLKEDALFPETVSRCCFYLSIHNPADWAEEIAVKQVVEYLGYFPPQEISVSSGCNQTSDHRTLGLMVLHLAEFYHGLIDMSGAITPPSQSVPAPLSKDFFIEQQANVEKRKAYIQERFDALAAKLPPGTILHDYLREHYSDPDSPFKKIAADMREKFGLILPPRSKPSLEEISAYVQAMPGKVYEIYYETESNGRWVYHIVDTAFMRAWLNHPRFRMIK